MRTFETEYEVAPGVLVHRTGGHTPGHSVVRLASGGDRLTFAGDAVFAVGFEHPDWYNGFEHDPEEAARETAQTPMLRRYNLSWFRLKLETDLAAPRAIFEGSVLPGRLLYGRNVFPRLVVAWRVASM
jgi:glyoxylase-like metal-dependent hydrolase (beta-lactamase superfamily II)